MPRSVDQAEESVLRRMRESGATLGDMASALGVSGRTVSRKLASLGLSCPRCGADDAPAPGCGLFEPAGVLGDGPLARRYRQQLEDMERCKER